MREERGERDGEREKERERDGGEAFSRIPEGAYGETMSLHLKRTAGGTRGRHTRERVLDKGKERERETAAAHQPV